MTNQHEYPSYEDIRESLEKHDDMVLLDMLALCDQQLATGEPYNFPVLRAAIVDEQSARLGQEMMRKLGEACRAHPEVEFWELVGDKMVPANVSVSIVEVTE
jgi:hypothetical protein